MRPLPSIWNAGQEISNKTIWGKGDRLLLRPANLPTILLYGRILGTPQKLIVVVVFQRVNWTGSRHWGTKDGSGAAAVLLFETQDDFLMANQSSGGEGDRHLRCPSLRYSMFVIWWLNLRSWTLFSFFSSFVWNYWTYKSGRSRMRSPYWNARRLLRNDKKCIRKAITTFAIPV